MPLAPPEVLSGAKSDAGDAAVIAEYLRLRYHRLAPAAPYSDETRACAPPLGCSARLRADRCRVCGVRREEHLSARLSSMSPPTARHTIRPRAQCS